MSVLFRKSYKYLGFLSAVALALVVLTQTRSDHPGAVEAQSLPPSPVAWWIFGEPEGEFLLDSMGNGFDAEVIADDAVARFAAAFPSDAPGSALHIIGNAGKGIISIPELYDFPFESGFTVAAWVHADSFPSGGKAPEGRGGSPIPPDEWAHLALTYDGDAASLYLNGTVVDYDPLATSHLPLATFVSDLVANDFGIEWQGDVADIRLYDIPLTQPEIEEMFLESAEFIEALASTDPKATAVVALRALGGAKASRLGRFDEGDDPPSRGPILSPNATPVPANTLFQILTPMEK